MVKSPTPRLHGRLESVDDSLNSHKEVKGEVLEWELLSSLYKKRRRSRLSKEQRFDVGLKSDGDLSFPFLPLFVRSFLCCFCLRCFCSPCPSAGKRRLIQTQHMPSTLIYSHFRFTSCCTASSTKFMILGSAGRMYLSTLYERLRSRSPFGNPWWRTADG